MKNGTHDHKLERIRQHLEVLRVDIGLTLQERRESLGLSRSQMANRIGVHFSQIWRWENGETLPRDEPTIRLTAACYRLTDDETNKLRELVFGNANIKVNTSLLKALQPQALRDFGIEELDICVVLDGVVILGIGKIDTLFKEMNNPKAIDAISSGRYEYWMVLDKNYKIGYFSIPYYPNFRNNVIVDKFNGFSFDMFDPDRLTITDEGAYMTLTLEELEEGILPLKNGVKLEGEWRRPQEDET